MTSQIKLNPLLTQHKEWVSLFRQTRVTTSTQSLLYVKKFTAIALSTITFNRGVFASNQYDDFTLDGRPVKLLRGNYESKRACLFTSWIKSCYQAIEKQYLRELTLEISSTDGNIIELYTLTFSYVGNKACINMSQGTGTVTRLSSRLNSYRLEDIQDSTSKMIRSITRFTQNLKPLPESYIIQLRITYYDEVTPLKYQPKFFSSANPKSVDGNLKIDPHGDVSTNFHSVNLQSGSLLKLDPVVQSSNVSNALSNVSTPSTSKIYEIDDYSLESPELNPVNIKIVDKRPKKKFFSGKSKISKKTNSSNYSTAADLSCKQHDIYSIDEIIAEDADSLTEADETSKEASHTASTNENNRLSFVPPEFKESDIAQVIDIRTTSVDVYEEIECETPLDESQLNIQSDQITNARAVTLTINEQNEIDSSPESKSSEELDRQVNKHQNNEVHEHLENLLQNVCRKSLPHDPIITENLHQQDGESETVKLPDSGPEQSSLSFQPSLPSLQIQVDAQSNVLTSQAYSEEPSQSSSILDMTNDPAAVDEGDDSSDSENDIAVDLSSQSVVHYLDLEVVSPNPSSSPSKDLRSDALLSPQHIKLEKEDYSGSQQSIRDVFTKESSNIKERYSLSDPMGVSSYDINIDHIKKEISQSQEEPNDVIKENRNMKKELSETCSVDDDINNKRHHMSSYLITQGNNENSEGSKRLKLDHTLEIMSQATASYSSFIHTTKDTSDEAESNTNTRCICQKEFSSDDVFKCSSCNYYHHVVCYGFLPGPAAPQVGCCFLCSSQTNAGKVCTDPRLPQISGNITLFALYRQILVYLKQLLVNRRHHFCVSDIATLLRENHLIAEDFIHRLNDEGFIRQSSTRANSFSIKEKRLQAIIHSSFIS